MDIIMIRHGQSQANVAGVYGQDQARLSDQGRREIEAAKKTLEAYDFSKVYVSPLVRTQESLEILGFDAEMDERIAEFDFGIFSGLTNREIEEDYPLEYEEWVNNPFSYSIEGGESLNSVYERVAEFLEEVSKKDENILLVSHAGVIRLAFCWIFDNVEHFFRFKVDNASINVITIEDDFKYIKRSNYNPSLG